MRGKGRPRRHAQAHRDDNRNLGQIAGQIGNKKSNQMGADAWVAIGLLVVLRRCRSGVKGKAVKASPSTHLIQQWVVVGPKDSTRPMEGGSRPKGNERESLERRAQVYPQDLTGWSVG